MTSSRGTIADSLRRSHAEDRVYGEIDTGGTQVLYLSHVPFATLGLPNLSPEARPGRELRFQVLLYKWLAIPSILHGIGTPIADPKRPLEVLRTVHSFDPCMRARATRSTRRGVRWQK